MQFKVEDQLIEWTPQKVVIAGYTSKDQESLKKHIDELKEQLGVEPPKRVPMLYEVSNHLLQTNSVLTEVGNGGSGEAEVVLCDINGKWYVGLGSDHTDRSLEAVSVQKSKQVTAKPITDQLWPLETIEPYWDELVLESWVEVNGKEQLYQQGKLSEFMEPKQLLEIIQERGYFSSEIVIFCGTLPIVDGEFVSSRKFKARLYDPIKNRELTLAYEVEYLKDAEEV
ncbi:DUF2848 family protein [Alkalihalobacterium alkalinitrilicum]|uniref:DUF2848 family protein n=1 Tax=Alkalihalobacterium alkalinitrilicum TaxID=427920 RepID=UPI00099583E9|nr:DUF2848 family protein [Alkalihalobacterium alkalinitrilicum]